MALAQSRPLRLQAAASCGPRLLTARRSAAMAAPCRSRTRTVSVKALTLTEEKVVLPTLMGPMPCQVFRPSAPGKYPGLVLFSEIFQVTDPIIRTSKIMASHGFVVLVPDVYHEFLKPYEALSYADPSGADMGNELKITKTVESYDSDSAACVKWLTESPLTTGKVGVMGFCLGGHLAYRGSLNKGVLAGACIYPTDIHKGALGKGMKDNSLQRVQEFADNGTEMMFVWGRQDPHVPAEGRRKIWEALNEAGVLTSWHEFNGQHAFMRDEGPRYDAELAMQVYSLLVSFFRRKLGEGSLPPPKDTGAKESKH